MLPVQETQHVVTARALLIDQFKGKPVIQGYLDVLSRRVQEVENVLWDIIEKRRLDVAAGVQLDGLGRLVGERRIGRNDTDYRTAIRLRIRVNRSKGRIVDVIDVAMLASGAVVPRVTEYQFLGFQVEIYGQTGERYIADLLSRTRAATSYGVLVASDLAASALLVFDDAVTPEAGIQTFADAISGGRVCASAYGLPSDFTGIVLSSGVVAPTLLSVSTAGGTVGDIDGGYPATLTGTGFVIGATTVTFGGTSATSVVVSSPTSLTCTVPAHAFGAVSVVVSTAGGSNAPNTAFEYFSMAQLSFAVLNVADFPGSPWAGTASAGTSSGLALSTLGVIPSAGSAQNGKIPADFNGTTQGLMNATGMLPSIVSASTFTVFALFLADTAAAPSVGYDESLIFGDSGGNFGLTFTTSGIGAFCFGSGVPLRKAASTGSYHLAMMRLVGGTMGLTLDSAVEVPVAESPLGGTGVTQIGPGNSGGRFDGRLLMVAASPVDLTASYAKIKSAMNTKFGLAL